MATAGVTDPLTRVTLSQLWRIDVMTGAKRQIAMKEDGVQPAWSPHGKRIAFWGASRGDREAGALHGAGRWGRGDAAERR